MILRAIEGSCRGRERLVELATGSHKTEPAGGSKKGEREREKERERESHKVTNSSILRRSDSGLSCYVTTD